MIDEAYGLYPGDNVVDQYRSAVLDTLVGEISGVPGEDRVVLMLGYKHEMERMLRGSNPGLARRFNVDDAFVFNDFSLSELT